MPGGAFDSAELRMKLHRIASGKVAIVPRELVAYEIAALLPEQNTALRIEFARFFRARCKRALELRCSEVGLRFDWERMFREPRPTATPWSCCCAAVSAFSTNTA